MSGYGIKCGLGGCDGEMIEDVISESRLVPSVYKCDRCGRRANSHQLMDEKRTPISPRLRDDLERMSFQVRSLSPYAECCENCIYEDRDKTGPPCEFCRHNAHLLNNFSNKRKEVKHP